MAARVGDWVEALEAAYDPRWAEPWDAVGLVCGDPDAPCEDVLFAIDPVAATVEEAVARGARLLVTHHPLLLRGVHGVPVTDYKGTLVTCLVEHGVALYVAHTNADNANPGVSDVLARVLGVEDALPLSPGPPDDAAKLVVYVPASDAAKVVDALASAGAGTIGEYDRCAWWVDGTGTFEARPGTSPAVGEPGERTETSERRVEMVVPHARLSACVRALLAAHPYEEPAYDVLPVLLPNDRGVGRIGTLASPATLGEFVSRVADALPTTVNAVRASGDPERRVERVAVCGGSGDDLIDTARRAGADVYVTADLRHHPASEAAERGLALVDAGHWASEWPWLADAAERVGRLGRTHVSTIVTDPWSLLA